MISVSAGGWLVSAGCGGIFLLSAVGPRCGSWLSAAGVACGVRPMGCLFGWGLYVVPYPKYQFLVNFFFSLFVAVTCVNSMIIFSSSKL